MIIKRLPLLAAAGVGYVLGTKAGRERYEQILQTFNKVKDDPRVQEKTQQATDLAKQKAPIVKDKLADAADKGSSKVESKVGSSNGSSTSTSSVTSTGTGTSSDPALKLNPESTALQDNPGPKGDLP
jgi:hypothetical protein